MSAPLTDIFFDLDHTLWDFEKNSAATFEMLFTKHQIDIDLQRFNTVYKPINRRYWKAYRNAEISKETLRFGRLRDAFDTLNYGVDSDLIQQLSEGYINYLTSFSHVFDYTHETLSYLQSKYRLHILTNGFKEIQSKKLSGARIDHFFTCVINAEEVGVKKPHRAIFSAALDQAKVSAECALMIGDDLEADVLGAINAGIRAIHFNNEALDTDSRCISISCLSELQRLL
ncbi:MAG: hypothetical protein RLZZ242_599 [Bacteroidota bacterium]